MASEDDNTGPEHYCGASSGHVIANRFVLQEGEPIKLFGKEVPDDSITWLDISNFKGKMIVSSYNFAPYWSVWYFKLAAIIVLFMYHVTNDSPS